MRAAIQSQGLRHPIVYGLGETDTDAMQDATEWASDMSALHCVEISDAMAALVVEAGGQADDYVVDRGRLTLAGGES